MHVRQWGVEIFISEEDSLTEARAVLCGDSPRAVTGVGHAQRNPADPQIPEIGDEVAVARALEDLSSQLLNLALT
jgi:hypothetical protein